MRVKCVICDTINNLDDDLPLAKKITQSTNSYVYV